MLKHIYADTDSSFIVKIFTPCVGDLYGMSAVRYTTVVSHSTSVSGGLTFPEIVLLNMCLVRRPLAGQSADTCLRYAKAKQSLKVDWVRQSHTSVDAPLLQKKKNAKQESLTV